MIVPGSANALMLGQSTGGYNLTNSLRFRSSASAYLSRTYGTSPTSRTTMTWSGWVKRGILSSGTRMLFGTGNNYENAYFNSSDVLVVNGPYMSGQQGYFVTTQVFRDPAAWYHIVIVYDTTNATATDRLRLYVNGTRVTSFSSSTNSNQNNTTTEWLVSGAQSQIASTAGVNFLDGYIAELNVIDGQALTPSSFGQTDTITGSWIPVKYTGTYGTNGFYLPFSNTASTTTLGYDFSGNGNNWTTNNISVTTGSTYDSMTDVPTLTSATTANYCVLNPLLNTPTLANGNLYLNYSTQYAAGTLGVTTGKFYFEATIISQNTYNLDVGVMNQNHSGSVIGVSANSWGIIVQNNANNGDLWNNGTTVASGVTFAVGDVVGVAFDVDAGKIWWSKNGTFVQSGNPASGTNAQYSNLSGTIFPAGSSYQNSGGSLAFNFGQQGFKYTPPTGYVALNTYNLPTSTIVAGNKVMDATLYTGTGAALTVSNAGSFKPDLVWNKKRSASASHLLTDSVRGVTKELASNLTDAEQTITQGITSFNSSGFSLGDGSIGAGYGSINDSGATYVAWQWQAGQGTTSSNTSGSITSTVSVNATAGFSIVSYTGTGSAATVGHGLGVAPSFIVCKVRNNAGYDWHTYHASLGATKYLSLNLTDAAGTASSVWNNTAPTSSVFSVANNGATNGSGFTIVAYCWAEIAGFSKFGSYTGNASTDGPFVYLGFRPKFIMFKNSATGNYWRIMDTSVNTYNVTSYGLYPNDAAAEGTATNWYVDYLSNGFKVRASTSELNGSGNTIIYAAFAESPFKNALAR